MPWNIQIGNPFGGLAAFGAGYGNAKRDAEIETERLQAQQNQRMADTLGESIGRIGAGYAQGKTRRYELDWQAQQEQKKYDWTAERDRRKNLYDLQAKGLEYSIDKAMADYREGLRRETNFEKQSGGFTKEQALAIGNQIYNEMPVEQLDEVSHALGFGDGVTQLGSEEQKALSLHLFNEHVLAPMKQRSATGNAQAAIAERMKSMEEFKLYNQYRSGAMVIADPQTNASMQLELSNWNRQKLAGKTDDGMPLTPDMIQRGDAQIQQRTLMAAGMGGGFKKPPQQVTPTEVPLPDGSTGLIYTTRDGKPVDLNHVADKNTGIPIGEQRKVQREMEKDVAKQKKEEVDRAQKEIEQKNKRYAEIQKLWLNLVKTYRQDMAVQDEGDAKKWRFPAHDIVEQRIRKDYPELAREWDAARSNRGGQSPSATAGLPSPQGDGAAPASGTQYPEGTRARGRNGEIREMRGGQWVPVNAGN